MFATLITAFCFLRTSCCSLSVWRATRLGVGGRGTARSPRKIANGWIQRADALQPGVVSTKPGYFLKSPSSTWSLPYFPEVLVGKGYVTDPCARDSSLWSLISVTLLLSRTRQVFCLLVLSPWNFHLVISWALEKFSRDKFCFVLGKLWPVEGGKRVLFV